MTIDTGVLLPQDIMNTAWFFYLAAFVAFNTLVFVGLSIGRIVYWPRPLSWMRVRSLRRDFARVEHRTETP